MRKDAHIWTMVIIAMIAALVTHGIAWKSLAASPPSPERISSIHAHARNTAAMSKLRLLPAIAALDLRDLSEKQKDALIKNLKHLRSSGDKDFRPAVVEKALSPNGEKLLRKSLNLYTELYWDLEHAMTNDYVWRELFKEVVFSKYYPKY